MTRRFEPLSPAAHVQKAGRRNALWKTGDKLLNIDSVIESLDVKGMTSIENPVAADDQSDANSTFDQDQNIHTSDSAAIKERKRLTRMHPYQLAILCRQRGLDTDVEILNSKEDMVFSFALS